MDETERELSIDEVVELIGMSKRWLQNLVRSGAIEYQKYGNRVRFTPLQVTRLRAKFRQEPLPPPPITTGRPRRR